MYILSKSQCRTETQKEDQVWERDDEGDCGHTEFVIGKNKSNSNSILDLFLLLQLLYSIALLLLLEHH